LRQVNHPGLLNFPAGANLTTVKSLRILLLLLFAVLLPIRGAMAGALPCGGGHAHSHGEPSAVQPLHADHAHHGSPSSPHDAATQVAPHGDLAGSHHGHAGSADKCNLCASCCGALCLLGTPVALGAAPAGTQDFPRPHLPLATFIPAGQERPPRSI
jgi:hypothetical protein